MQRGDNMDIGEEVRVIDVEEIDIAPVEEPIEIPEPRPANTAE